MTALEAFNELKWLYNQGFEVIGWHLNGELEPLNNFLDNFYEPIKQALTPPTADEVCEALIKHIKREVTYRDKGFYIVCDNGLYLITKIQSGGHMVFDLTYTLPPHLITLIGRFYEGESK